MCGSKDNDKGVSYLVRIPAKLISSYAAGIRNDRARPPLDASSQFITFSLFCTILDGLNFAALGIGCCVGKSTGMSRMLARHDAAPKGSTRESAAGRESMRALQVLQEEM
jgi:hypothetical protein